MKTGLRTVVYNPFASIKNFYLIIDAKLTPKFLLYDNFSKSYKLIIKPGGHIPKSGILLSQNISSLVLNKKVLDIGTGETGVMAIHSSKCGAKKVVACDVNQKSLLWARKNSQANHIKNIKWIKSSLFDKLKGKFDFIISNPPQMPMKSGPLHDSGGIDGRSYIDKIIEDAPQYLEPGGSLVLLVFDFLSAVKKYGTKRTIFSSLKEKGFKTSIIASEKRFIRRGGQTEKSIKYIKKVYPKFNFFKDKKGRIFHRVFILLAH